MIRTVALLVLLLSSAAVNAGIMVYDDRGDFIADTGATAIGAFPSVNTSSVTVGGVTFTGSINSTMNWSTLISEDNDLAINGVENFAAAQSSFDMYAFGFDFHEPSRTGLTDGCNATCFDTTFEVALFLGASQVGVFSFNRPNDSLEFVGVHSSEAFDRVTVTDVTNTIDNEFFGNFLVGTTPKAVPEPGTLGLLGLGLLALVLTAAGRKRA